MNSRHKLNSRDLYGQLTYGGVYEVEIRGTRHDNLGQYLNIIKIVKVITQGHRNPAVVKTTIQTSDRPPLKRAG